MFVSIILANDKNQHGGLSEPAYWLKQTSVVVRENQRAGFDTTPSIYRNAVNRIF
jgi:hypothetical protein